MISHPTRRIESQDRQLWRTFKRQDDRLAERCRQGAKKILESAKSLLRIHLRWRKVELDLGWRKEVAGQLDATNFELQGESCVGAVCERVSRRRRKRAFDAIPRERDRCVPS